MTPFFDTRDAERIKLALTILSYPDRYCLKDENLERLARLLPATDGVRYLVQTLKEAQAALAPHLPLPFDDVWSQREALPASFVPATNGTSSPLPAAYASVLGRALDRGLLDETLDMMAKDIKGVASLEGVGLALACAWLSQHLALVAIGIAKVELTGPREFVISPAGSDAIQHLCRLWFAAAFEEMSLRKAQASLELYALLANGSKDLKGDVEVAFADALSMIPQHRRLPPDKGPVAELLDKQLRPLLWLAGAVFHAAEFRKGRPIVQRDLPAQKAFRHVFADVMAHQLTLLPLDRAFEVRKGGLVLGPRKLVPGLLLIAEQMATNRLGPKWHNKPLSDVQKNYLIARLESLPHVQVIDVEISMGDTTDKVHVDVDLFVRDRQNDILFAVQLKHFEYSNKGGVRYWLERFRPNKLAYGIAQLEAFGTLAKTDSKVRNKLLGGGIAAEELDRVVPVVLHNVGLLDCLAFQAGVLVYDQHTFVNVLDGRSAVGVGAMHGQAVHLKISGGSAYCRLDDPDGVISAYVSDPQFAGIAYFDAVADVTRSLHVVGSAVAAQGLGL